MRTCTCVNRAPSDCPLCLTTCTHYACCAKSVLIHCGTMWQLPAPTGSVPHEELTCMLNAPSLLNATHNTTGCPAAPQAHRLLLVANCSTHARTHSDAQLRLLQYANMPCTYCKLLTAYCQHGLSPARCNTANHNSMLAEHVHSLTAHSSVTTSTPSRYLFAESLYLKLC
jgi:hypothetical protein